ncbi:hypothetical protein SAMD00019534_114310, partial [Acytostelium subglobosum LB1]|uniref:hypothetical protein n=1 Tax=Acytostelium subglobosum LB1 TaxID=1410327 RepID=UPI0006451DF2
YIYIRMARRKSKQKLVITASEWVNDFGGKKEGEKRSNEKPLPYYCCSLSLQPFDDPMCTPDGNIYEMLNIIPFLKKYGKDPVTGKPMTMKDLFKANFAVNDDDEYHCPIMKKVFTDFSHIVINKRTGNVYCHEAVQKLNFEAKHYFDLIDDTPFIKADILTIQNPADRSLRNLSNFHFIRAGLDIKDESSKTSILNKDLEQFKREKEAKAQAIRKQSGQAPSFTSTGFGLNNIVEDHPADAPGKKTKRKGYVKLRTNLGDLNLQLHCDLTPKACENFLELCETGYYNGVSFHRLIKNFMVQGGDPQGTGTGGQSIWKKQFADEFKPSLSHSERGILSMANSGPNTNGSQFFITFRACPHLDRKHTVFGKVVGGMEVLKTMEMIKVDDNDKPQSAIKINSVVIYDNPFRSLDEEEFEELKKQELKKKEKDSNQYDQSERGQWYSNPTTSTTSTTNATNKTGVGKYLVDQVTSTTKKSSSSSPAAAAASSASTSTLKRQIIEERLNETKKPKTTYGNFSAW